MASGGSAALDAYDEEAAVRRPLELDGRDAAASPGGELEALCSMGP